MTSPPDDDWHSAEVASIVEELVWKVESNDTNLSGCHHQSLLPPLLNGEYDVVLPVTPVGLMLNVGKQNGGVAFLGYRQYADGTKGLTETRNLV
jgi:hypothetical protein